MKSTATPVYVALRVILPFALTIVGVATWIDSALARRRRRSALLMVLLLAVSGCASRPMPAPEPPRIDRLDCGGKACTITTSGRATIVWVSE